MLITPMHIDALKVSFLDFRHKRQLSTKTFQKFSFPLSDRILRFRSGVMSFAAYKVTVWMLQSDNFDVMQPLSVFLLAHPSPFPPPP
jgi:hypothetical protein